jgi:cytochrome oxidase assembly protein ShyY1
MALRWDIEWRLALFTALLLPLLVSLGFWQLSRAEEKVLLAEQETRRAARAPAPLADLLGGPVSGLAFLPVKVSGYFHPEILIYKDNQLRGGRYGVDVLGLFYDRAADHWVLLNRGWVPADPARQSLPEVAIPDGELTLDTRAYVPPGEPYVLEAERFDRMTWPLLVQDIGAPALRRALEETLDAPLFAVELRLLPGQPGGFRRDWPIMNSSPAKHRGYALQWFTMAAALLLLFVLRSSNLAALLRGRRA